MGWIFLSMLWCETESSSSSQKMERKSLEFLTNLTFDTNCLILKILNSEPDNRSSFGSAVAISGTNLVIGAQEDKSPSGVRAGNAYYYTEAEDNDDDDDDDDDD